MNNSNWKYIAFIMSMVMAVLIFSGCSVSESEAKVEFGNDNVAGSPSAAMITDEPRKELSEAPDQNITKDVNQNTSYEIPDVQVMPCDIPDTEAFQFIRDMKIGWNLGNTFDANDSEWVEKEMDYEKVWCGVITTEEMIINVKNAGFNTIRIPVSWHNHVSGKDYKINKEWIERVQEVVDYAINNDMYAIINIHHDFSTDYIYPTSDYLKQSEHYIRSVWKQLSKRFAHYDSRLIFESMNEPRMVGSKYEWWINNNDDSCKDAIESINKLNQVFVDTVRATGGNNAMRYLLVPGYDASPEGALNSGFRLPKDTAKDKLIVSVHAYTPYSFALQNPNEEKSVSTFDSDNASNAAAVSSFMDELYNKFIINNTPVLIGEFGARDKSSNTQDRIDFSTYYIAAARARGMTCIWWDNNAFTGKGELFGLLDRKQNIWQYPEIVEGLMKYAQ